MKGFASLASHHIALLCIAADSDDSALFNNWKGWFPPIYVTVADLSCMEPALIANTPRSRWVALGIRDSCSTALGMATHNPAPCHVILVQPPPSLMLSQISFPLDCYVGDPEQYTDLPPNCSMHQLTPGSSSNNPRHLNSDDHASLFERIARKLCATYLSTPLHHLVLHQAKVTPNTPAICCGAETLTYHEFCAGAWDLASIMGSHVPRGSHIAICVPKCTWLPVVWMASCLSGCPFTSIDLRLPSTTIQYQFDLWAPQLIVCWDPGQEP